eukprot:SM000207S06190  [mRNA]  locus=s207:106699:109683:- [translate_table: standard]
MELLRVALRVAALITLVVAASCCVTASAASWAFELKDAMASRAPEALAGTALPSDQSNFANRFFKIVRNVLSCTQHQCLAFDNNVDVSQGTRVEEAAPRRELRGLGWWTAKGNLLYDNTGATVYGSGITWNGFEWYNGAPNGLSVRNYYDHINQMSSLGFNLLRLPFSGSLFQSGGYTPMNINYGVNSDLQGLKSLDILDKVINAAGGAGMKVLLDFDRVGAGYNSNRSGHWWEPKTPVPSEAAWVSIWTQLAARYKDNPTVIGFELWNEPHNPTVKTAFPGPVWAGDGVLPGYNWRLACKRQVHKAADAIQAINPNVLIVVQGLWQDTFWGANLIQVKKYPLVLMVPGKLVYATHDYGPYVWNQKWFWVKNFPYNLPKYWERTWGYINTEGIAPLWVSESGSPIPAKAKNITDVHELGWFTTFRAYVYAKRLTWCWFTWGTDAESRDTGGVLEADWRTPQAHKFAELAQMMHPGFGPSPKWSQPASPGPKIRSRGRKS